MEAEGGGIEILLMLSGALAIDLVLGEPPRIIHPVVWMGKVVSFLERFSFLRQPRLEFIYGCGMTLITTGLFVVPAHFMLLYSGSFSFVAYMALSVVLLKCTFSGKELHRVARKTKELLAKGRLDEARFEMRSLVSRDTRDLPQPLMVSATVESVAENTCDSFVAPLFYFLLLGIPGAIAYRVVNTLDAMVGYHGRYEYLGKFASRLDDVLNFIPARLTGLLLVLATFLARGNAATSWAVMRRDHAKTESPNAGWSMAAIAGALNIRLEKVGHYRLGEANAPLVPQTVDAALKLALIAMLLWVTICFIIGVVRFVLTT